MKGELSENDLKYKAEAYCSSMERCVADVEAKLSQWGATPEMMEKIVRHLQDERYIDQKRFCSAFVRDKYRFYHSIILKEIFPQFYIFVSQTS